MENNTIELFMPLAGDVFDASLTERLVSLEAVSKVWLLSASPVDAELPGKVSVLQVDSLQKSILFKDMAERASADYVLFLAKEDVDVDADKMRRSCATPAHTSYMRAEEIEIDIEKENKEKQSACVCLDDTQQTQGEEAPTQTDYRSYNKYLSR